MARYKTRTHKTWTPEEEVLLREAWEGTTPSMEIARQLGRTHYSILVKMNRLFGKRDGAMLETHYSVVDLARELGVSVFHIHSYFKAGLRSYERGMRKYITKTDLIEWFEQGHWNRKFNPATEDMKTMILDAEMKLAKQTQHIGYLTRTQIMEAFGIGYQSVSNWLSRGFPQPTYNKRTAYWDIDEVSIWAKNHDKLHLLKDYLSRHGELNSPTHRA